jgi:hypothetical protein
LEAKTNEELKEIAQGLLSGTIFSDRHLENPEEIPRHFMPIAFGCLSNLTENEKRNIGLIYEWVEKAGPLAINGKPCFMSARLLTFTEMEKVCDYMRKIEQAVAEM